MAAPTAIIYNSKRLIPAPQLNFSRSHRRSGDKSIVGTEHQVTLSGELVGCKGWDFSSGSPEFYEGSDYPADDTPTTCNKFANMVEMQEQLRDLFEIGEDYHWFEVIGCDGLIRKWRARVLSIDFAEGRWVEIVPYTIVLELQTDGEYDENLNIDTAETWDVQWDENNGGIFTLEHTLSCQSEEFARDPNDIKDGWKVAKYWIEQRLAGSDYVGAGPATIKNDLIFEATGFNLQNYTAYNYTVAKSIDEYNGTYSITESWTLAKDPVFRTWTITVNDPRDEYVTVSVEGEFRSLLDRTASTEVSPTNTSAAIDALKDWDSAGGPYDVANQMYVDYGGCGTLGSCPVNKSITNTTEQRGEDLSWTDAHGEAVRVAQFSYEFSDADPDAEVSITRSVEESYVERCAATVSIQGEIQGHTCDCETTKLENATLAYEAISCSDEAEAVYATWGGTGTLTQTRSSYTENERDGTISFSCEFTDEFVDGVIQEERITVGWTCGDLKTGGESKSTYSVEGTIRGPCDGETPAAPDPSVYNCQGDSCCELKRKSVTTDSKNNTVSYNYEWDNDCGPGLVEIVVDLNNGPENCEETLSSVELSVQGTGCDSATMLASAETALASVDADSHAPSGSCRLSWKRNINKTRGNIRETYTYTTECDATSNVTITEMYDQSTCDEASYSIEGEIKGACYLAGGAAAAAEALYQSDHLPSDYSTYGCLSSSRVSRNEKNGTVRFSYEFKDCTDGYEHEQTVTTKTDDQDCCTEVTLSGTIIPYCDPDTGVDGMVTTGENAWTTIQSTLEADAQDYCSQTVALRTTTVTRNKKNGQITYSYTYQCCNTCIEGVLKESINITKEFPADVVAIVPILGRTCGPIVQYKGTQTVEKCTVAIDLTYAKECGCSMAKPSGLESDVQGIISAVGCCSDSYGTYTERDTESWNPRSGRYTRTVTFICECC